MTENIKRQLAKAKKLIQSRQYAKARELLWCIDHPTATKWLIKLDEIDPQPKAKAKAKSRSQQIKIGLLVGGLLIIGAFLVFLVVENRMVESRVDAVIQVREEANQFCRDAGFTGTRHGDCVERRLAYFRCEAQTDEDIESCLARELPTTIPPTARPTELDFNDFPTFTPTPQ